MTDRKDIELRIRATDQSKQTLDAVASSVTNVTKALDEQVAAARRGDESIDGLKQSLTDLKEAGSELIRQQSLIDTFNRQAEALGKASIKSEEAAAKYNALKEALNGVDEPTKRQIKSLETAEARMQRTQAANEKMNATVAKTATALAEAGIGITDLNSAQDKLANNATAVGSSIAAINQALVANVSASKAAAAAAKAHKEALDLESRSYEKSVEATKRAAEEEAAALAQVTKQQEAAQHIVRESAQASFWRGVIDDMDAADKKAAEAIATQERAQKVLAAFKAQVSNQQMTTNGFKTFSAPGSAGTAGNDLGGSLKAITDPSEAARQSVDGLEKQVNSLSMAVAATRGPVQNYSESVRTLQAAMKEIVGTGESIDAFRQQVEAVRAARAQFVSARTDVQRYTEAIKAATAPDDNLTAGLKRAQAALNAAGREMKSSVETAREMQASLQKAGVSTNDLAGAEVRLTDTARTATSALTMLNTAYRDNGSAAEAGTNKVKLFGEGNRESLSWVQRVRGELIALATAYVGIQGAISLASGSIEAFVQKQAAENRLGIVLGSPDKAAIAGEYDYVHRQAERLGIGIKELADSYSRFALAGKNANMTLDQTKFAFERITEVMRVNHASTEAVNGAFYQLEQMLSKNKVQMDDLRQASNWIPGLEGMLARGLGMVSVKQLFDAMKKGSVDAKTAILSLGEEMERQYGKQIPDALKSLQAEQGRFQTGLTDFKLLIATSGFADAYVGLLQKLSAFFKSSDGQRFAKDLSSAFTALTEVAKVLVDNIALVKAVVIALVEIKAFMWAADLATKLAMMAEASAAAAVQQQALAAATAEAAAAQALLGVAATEAGAATVAASSASATALGLVSKALGIIGAALVGVQIGNYLYNQVPAVRRTAIEIVEYFDYATDVIGMGFSSLADKIVGYFKALPSRISNSVKELAAMAVEAADPGGSMGADAAAKIRSTKTADPTSGGTDPTTTRFAARKAQFDARMSLIQEHNGYPGDGRDLTPAEQKKADAAAQAADPRGFAAQKDLVDQIASSEKGLNDIIAERATRVQDIIDKRKKGELTETEAEKQAETVRMAYKPKLQAFAADAQKSLQPLIDAVGFKAPADKLQDFRSRLSAATGAYEPNLEGTEKKPKGDPIGTMDRSLQNDLSSMLARVDRTTIGTFDERLKASGAAIEEQYSAIFRKIAQYQKIGGSSIGGQDLGAIKAQVQASEDQLKAAAALKLETAEIAKNETTATNIVKQRTDAYKDIEDRVKAGSISPATGMAEAQKRGEEFNKQLDVAITKAIAFNEEMRGKPGIDNTKLDTANSTLRRLRSEGSQDGGKAITAVGSNLDTQAATGVNDILKERNDLTASYANLVKLGLMTQADAQKALQEDYARTHDGLTKAIDDYQTLIDMQKASNQISPTNYELATAKIKEMRTQVQYLNPDLVKLQKAFSDSFVNGFTTAFDKTASSIANLIDGSATLGDTWKALKNTVIDFFASFLKNIANAMIQIEALNIAQSLMGSSSSSGGGSGSTGLITGLFQTAASYYTGGASSAVNANVHHAGGIVGSGNVTRRVSAALFENAPRYHDGGSIGLKSDEKAAILQDGEKVLTKAQQASAQRQSAAASPAVAVKQTLAIGDDEIASAMAGDAGQQTTLTHIKRNKETIKQWLK